MADWFTQPFGEECCEIEKAKFRDHYPTYYFPFTPFNSRALESSTYLFVGRRGSGKTSLANYLSFQRLLSNASCIDVDEPKVYEEVLVETARSAARNPNIALTRIVDIWEAVIWNLLFDHFKERSPVIRKAALLVSRNDTASSLVRKLLKAIIDLLLQDKDGFISEDAEALLTSTSFVAAKREVLAITHHEPVIVAMDSLEKYAVDNAPMLRATAALIECSARLNTLHAADGLHIKTFISAEIFPHLSETEVSNPSKYIRRPLYLHWRPKDLMRLVAWRFYLYLKKYHAEVFSDMRMSAIDWQNHREVMSRAWTPVFGNEVVNGVGRAEKTFPYVLRHTQLRPRQFVILCNAIAEAAVKNSNFPRFDNAAIVRGVRQTELALATEVLNSYSDVYPNVANIVRAISGFPAVFTANELDKAAPSTASEWPLGDYSPYRFRRLLAELGIIGVARNYDKSTNIVAADFEYAIEDTLAIRDTDDCVVHPMFFEKFRINNSKRVLVHPFPSHPDFDEFGE